VRPFVLVLGPMRALSSLVLAAALFLGCSSDSDVVGSAAEGAAAEGRVVEPPFRVAGEAEGLVLTWYDEEGPHVAERRSDIPEAAREHVKVDSLTLAPAERNPDAVYVADLREERGGGYEVRQYGRDGFDTLLDEMHGTEAVVAGDVIVYGASWCGACRQAEHWLEQNGVPFVEKDIEEDSDARAEMLRKARAAGISTNGIPIIDVNGRLLTGFDPGAMRRALDGTRAATL